MRFNDRAARAYAARFMAESEIVGPTPTDEALRQAFKDCCRIPGPEHYNAIRAEIAVRRLQQAVLPLGDAA